MALEECIEHLNDLISKMECSKCKDEHIQLRAFLLELKDRREKDND